MTAVNAIAFALFGAVMEILPQAVPSLFPHSSVSSESARMVWTQLMGLVQIGIGLSALTRFFAIPAAARLIAVVQGQGEEGLALAEPRGDAGR